MYTGIVESTLKVMEEIPLPIPADGEFAGCGEEYVLGWNAISLQDNWHYPMGTTYIDYGLLGVAERAEAEAKRPHAADEVCLLAAISAVYRGMAAYMARYADAVEAAAGDSAHLTHVAAMLRALSTRAPQHLDEALQLIYLVWKLRCITTVGADIGRLDVHLRSLYEADIASGVLDEEKALELLCAFWRKLNGNCSGDTLVNVMVGGKNADGSDAGSRLSVLMLEATKRVRMTEPHINVRLHKGSDPALYRAMLEVQRMGQGQATVYNDEVVIPALIRFGIPAELACRYTNDGCTEIMLDGASGIDFTHIDAVAAFELALNNGALAAVDYKKPVKYYHKDQKPRIYPPDVAVGFASGDMESCTTFEELYAMFLEQYKYQTRVKADILLQMEKERAAGLCSGVLLNGTFESVLQSGKDILRGGLPFAEYMIFSGSVPAVADCLAALRETVFEKKLYTVAEIKEAILHNFEGYEVMRRHLLAAPKFGNDIDSVDLLAADIAAHFCDWLDEYRAEHDFPIMPALVGWRFMEEGWGVAATPDGRRYGESIAEHYCANPGKAVNGPTALIASIAKAREVIARAVGVTAVHVSLPANLGDSEEQELAVLDGIVKASLSGGLSELNIAIYDVDLLRRAQQFPEQHKDLIVRVWGFSARFVDLCEDMQNHVISRAMQL